MIHPRLKKSRYSHIFKINHYKGGDDEDYGGAFLNSANGKLTFRNCTFENNSVLAINRANGGAIDNSGELFVVNCLFKNNIANNTNSSGFRKNCADGGALSNIGTMYVQNCDFIANKALRNGGAIRTQDNGNANIRNCNFIDNIAAYHLSGGSFGGAIYTWDCGINIYDSTFKNNRVYDASGYGAQGGAISSDRGAGIINIQNCEFIGNSAKGVGTADGQSIFLGSVEANVNYCTIDTSIYSLSQLVNLDNNWWDVNDGAINKLIENLPSGVRIASFAELQLSSNATNITLGETVKIFAKLCWNGTDSEKDINRIPLRDIDLYSNCGILSESKGELVNGIFESELTLNQTDNPTITAVVDDVSVKYLITTVKPKVEFTATGGKFNSSENASISISYTEDSNGLCLIDVGDYKLYAELVNGTAYAMVPNLNPGNYSVLVRYLGEENLNATTTIIMKENVIPTKKKTAIGVSAKTFKVKSKSKKISVKLKANVDGEKSIVKGEKLTLKVNGKTYTAKTNSKGIAKFSIKLNKKGKYSAKVKFAGDDIYKSSKKSFKIIVK